MAQTLGDIISRNYSAGRAIGDDFSQMRFARGAAKIREEYAARAKEEQQPLDAYLPEMEDRLRELYTSSGSARRGVLGRSGQSLDSEYGTNLREEAGRLGERRAGALAMAGDQAGAREQRARTQYNMSNFDAGQSQQIAGDTILATQNAMNPDGTYDMAKGAQALAGVGARYGNADAANAQQQGAQSFRLQAARAKADAVFNMAQNPSAFSDDQFAGAWEGLKASVPELQNVDLRKGKDNILYIYTGGQPSGSIDPKNKTDVEELATIMGQFTKDPGAALQGYLQTRLQNIADAKAQDTDTAKRFSDARIAVVKDLQSAGLPPQLASSFVEAQSKLSSSGGGWQLQDIGDAPGTFIMQKDGQSYIIKTNVAPDPKTGAPGGTVQITDMDGTPMPGGALNRADRSTLVESLGTLASDIAASNYKLQTGILSDKLSVLNQLETQERGLTGSRAERNGNPGNIEDRGQFANNPDYIGSDGRFARFREGSDAGQRAMVSQLERYMDGKTRTAGNPGGAPRTTVADIVSQWSPEDDPTNPAGSTANYASYVARRLGVDPRAQLSKADIPRLAQAMSEFESGNTQRGALGAAGGQRTAVATPTPAQPQRATARSAPAAQAALQRRPTISPDYVRGAAGELNSQADTLRQKEAQLAQFDRDMGTQLRQVAGRSDASPGRLMPTNLTPEQARVRERLVEELETTRRSVQDATRELRSNTGALRRSTAQSRDDERAGELYARYGGAADFFSRAGESAGGSR